MSEPFHILQYLKSDEWHCEGSFFMKLCINDNRSEISGHVLTGRHAEILKKHWCTIRVSCMRLKEKTYSQHILQQASHADHLPENSGNQTVPQVAHSPLSLWLFYVSYPPHYHHQRQHCLLNWYLTDSISQFLPILCLASILSFMLSDAFQKIFAFDLKPVPSLPLTLTRCA